MLLFRIVSDSTDDDLMSYNMGVDLIDAPRQQPSGLQRANRTKRHSLRVDVARCRTSSANFAACRLALNQHQRTHFQTRLNGFVCTIHSIY